MNVTETFPVLVLEFNEVFQVKRSLEHLKTFYLLERPQNKLSRILIIDSNGSEFRFSNLSKIRFSGFKWSGAIPLPLVHIDVTTVPTGEVWQLSDVKKCWFDWGRWKLFVETAIGADEIESAVKSANSFEEFFAAIRDFFDGPQL